MPRATPPVAAGGGVSRNGSAKKTRASGGCCGSDVCRPLFRKSYPPARWIGSSAVWLKTRYVAAMRPAVIRMIDARMIAQRRLVTAPILNHFLRDESMKDTATPSLMWCSTSCASQFVRRTHPCEEA